ncbi:hypothetical protein H7X68_00770 [Candidatus Saccharibacteria bacterium]|nr:hypothetical protein [Candidatus Saccharibacteria bacterium]
MSRLVELANQGDAAIARFSKEHLPQSDEAIAKRARVRKVISGLALTGVVVGGGLTLTNEFLNAADRQAQHVQEVSDNSNYEQLIDHSIELPTLPSLEK